MYVLCTPISVIGFVKGLFSLLNGVFLMINKKVNPFYQWSKILVTVMRFAHTFE